VDTQLWACALVAPHIIKSVRATTAATRPSMGTLWVKELGRCIEVSPHQVDF
jgi:hypothetical protein